MIDEFCGELLKTHGEKCRGLLFQQAVGEGADATVRQGFRKCLDRLRALRPSGIAISSEDKHAFLVGDALAAVEDPSLVFPDYDWGANDAVGSSSISELY